MNPENLKLAAGIIDPNYIELASHSINSRENQVKILLSQRRLPDEGWDDLTIEHFLHSLAIMDTNNYLKKTGVGERESRIASDIVAKRNFFMGHGIGRSGDVKAVQPKAAGSSLIAKLTEYMTLDALKICGLQFVGDVIILPLATGMAITMTLLTLIRRKPKAKYVIWPRIDQKTCLKCISTANLEPIVIENIIEGESITTNIAGMTEKIKEIGAENILCVLSTTSCFAPRVPDKLEDIGKLCKEFDIFHVVNNAYGLQCSKICHSINQASCHGRVDAVIQSTDKNFMVPVGASIIFSKDKKVIQEISELYPGRASGSPILDLFITYLTLGRSGLKSALQERKENLVYFKQALGKFGEKYPIKILNLPNNTISIGISLFNLKALFEDKEADKLKNVSFLGSMLYKKRVMGSRVIGLSNAKNVCGIKFKNYGSHIDEYPEIPYMTAACSVGLTKKEIDWFIERLGESFDEIQKMFNKLHKPVAAEPEKKEGEIISEIQEKKEEVPEGENKP